jgi:glycosyltransferase involved in cell wall biosynthesis
MIIIYPNMDRYFPPAAIHSLTPWLHQAWQEVPPGIKEEAKAGLKRYGGNDPLISVVMIARNEAEHIFPALLGFARMDLSHATELIVVDNGSTDATPTILKDLGVKVVQEDTPGWTPARNAGLGAARGDIVLSADSDNLYPSQWINQLSEPLRTSGKTVATCSEYCFYKIDQCYPLSLHLYQYLRYFNNLLRHPKRPHLNCLGGSMGFKRAAALEAGGYMASGRGEDGELAYRLARLGRIVYVHQKGALSYASLRSVFKDGDLTKAFGARFKKHMARLFTYLTPQKNG